jgi:hypothetical protein
MTNYLWQAIAAPLRVFSREETKGKLAASTGVVTVAALLGSVGIPAAIFAVRHAPEKLALDPASMLLAFGASILSWLIVCLLFWALSRAFHNGLRLRQVLSVWGFSYVPNALCVLLYGGLQFLPNARVTSGIAAFLIGAAFLFLLVWKAITFFLFLRCTMNVSLRELVLTTLSSTVVFAALLWAGALAGIQVPML